MNIHKIIIVSVLCLLSAGGVLIPTSTSKGQELSAAIQDPQYGVLAKSVPVSAPVETPAPVVSGNIEETRAQSAVSVVKREVVAVTSKPVSNVPVQKTIAQTVSISAPIAQVQAPVVLSSPVSAPTPSRVSAPVQTPVVYSTDAPAPIAIVVPIPAGPSAGCEVVDFNAQFLCLINKHRAENGKGALGMDASLSSVALSYSTWLSQGNPFGHVGANGSKFHERCAQVGTSCYGENIAMGFISAAHLFELWKASPGHNANMLGNYTVMGFGVVGNYATNLFR